MLLIPVIELVYVNLVGVIHNVILRRPHIPGVFGVHLAVEQFIVAYTEVVVIFFVVHGLLLLGGFGRLLVSVGGFEVGDYLLCEVYIIEVVGIVGKVDNKCVLRYARFFFL